MADTVIAFDPYRYPVLSEFHDSDAFICAVQGPFGSGKSTASIYKLWYNAIEQPPAPNGTRYRRTAVVRNTYSQLQSTTIQTFSRWIPEEKFPVIGQAPIECVVDIALGDGTRLKWTVWFLALDKPADLVKVKSLDISDVWINEAIEVPMEMIDALTGRVGRYPDKKLGGCDNPQVIIDTNPGEDDARLYTLLEGMDEELVKKLEEKLTEYGRPRPLIQFFKQPGALILEGKDYKPNPAAENVDNINGGYGYYYRQVVGKSQTWINKFILGLYGANEDGKPVYGNDYDDERHYSKEKIEPVEGVPICCSFDFGLCYSDDTEVLTESGWKFFRDVNEGVDRVATLNPKGFGLEYTDINFKVEYDYDGELIEFKSQNFNFCVTPEHITPFTNRDSPASLRFLSAQELSKKTTSHKFVQLAAKSWLGEPMSFFGLPDNLAAKFLGWYVSEGSIYAKGNHYRIHICQIKPAPSLDATMSDPSWGKILWKKTKTGWWATVPPAMGKYILSLGKQPVRICPTEIMLAGREAIMSFLESYIAGDGHTRSRVKIGSGIGRKHTGEITAATTSAALKDQLQELALKVGWASASRIQKAATSMMRDGRVIKSRPIHIITFKRLDRAEILPSHVKRINYKGKIYCLNVPHHTLYIRRGGKVCWNGNTPAVVFLQPDKLGRLVVLDELVSFDMAAEEFIVDGLLPHIKEKYEQFSLDQFFVVCDPSIKRAETDARTPVTILKKHGFSVSAAYTNQPVTRQNDVRHFLLKKNGFIISKQCTYLRKGFQNGYKFRRLQISGERFSTSPEKNHFSHVHDALQYGAGFYAQRSRRKPKPVVKKLEYRFA